MKNLSFQRIISCLLVMMIVVTGMPIHAFAHQDHSSQESTDSSSVLSPIDGMPLEETSVLRQHKKEID